MKGGKPTPDKLNSIATLGNDALSRATDNYAEWTALLRTISRNYKYDFADQVLIHAQRPDASACAGYDVWTGRMGRYVRRGAKGIALVDNTLRLRYVFDVSDTGARKNSRPFEPWQVNSKNTGAVISALEARFGVEPVSYTHLRGDGLRDTARSARGRAVRRDDGGSGKIHRLPVCVGRLESLHVL